MQEGDCVSNVSLTQFNVTMFKNVCSVCSVTAAALMLLNNVLNTSKASLSLLCETYIWGHTKVYLKHLFDVLWDAYLHTEEALCKARADQPDFSLTLLQTSKNKARPQRFHTVRKSGHYTASIKFPENFQMYLRCSLLTVLSSQSVWLNEKGQVLEFGKRTKSTIGNLTFKSKNGFFKILLTMKIGPAVKVIILTVNCYS